MIGSQSEQLAVYFKQYPCYNFALFSLPKVKNHKRFNCSFSFTDGKLQSCPPATIVDDNQKKSVLYLCQWLEEKQYVYLFIRTLSEGQWMEIRMNAYPDFMMICGGSIFLVGGEELFIFSPSSLRTDLKKLQKDLIVSVSPTICEPGNKQELFFEPGASVVYHSERNGYYSAQYSINCQNVKIPVIKERLMNFFQKKKEKYVHLQIIVPDVLGLVFLDSKKMCVFNLYSMTILEQACVDVDVPEKPLVRWRKHQNTSQQDQTFVILVGVQGSIFSFSLKVKYNLIANKIPHLKSEPLANFGQGEVVDWSSVSLQPYLIFGIDGKYLMDMLISTKGLIYRSKDSKNDLLGSCKYIDMNHILNQCSIIIQECNIWRLHYQDKWEKSKVNYDRLLGPNRYSHELVQFYRENHHHQQDFQIQILGLWKEKYDFQSFRTFGDQILIVRNGSLSVLRNVQKELFDEEYLTTEQLQVIQPSYLENLRFQSYSGNLEENEKGFGLRVCRNRQLGGQRYYNECVQDLERLQIEKREQKFLRVIEELDNILDSDHPEKYHNLSTKQLQFELVCRQIQDKFSYFHLILTRRIYQYQGQGQRTFNRQYEKDTQIVRVISYFYDIYRRSALHYSLFGSNLVDLFVKQSVKRLSDDINATVCNILQMLLNHLFPKDKTSENSSYIFVQSDSYYWHSNAFVDLLISKLRVSFQNNEEMEVEILRKQLSLIANLGFFNHRSLLFCEQWSNLSLLKAVLLSDDQQLTQRVFLTQLSIKDQASRAYEQYRKVKDIMSESSERLIQKLLFLNWELHGLKVDSNELRFEQWLPKDQNTEIVQKYCKINEDILENEVMFGESLERLRHQLVAQTISNDDQIINETVTQELNVEFSN